MTQYRPSEGDSLYLLYTPIADSNLLLMHAIPRDVAYSEFGFVETSVVMLSAVLLTCVVLLVIFVFFSGARSPRNLVHYAQTAPHQPVQQAVHPGGHRRLAQERHLYRHSGAAVHGH